MKWPFITLQSVRGGSKLNYLGPAWPRKLETIEFTEETAKPVVIQDYFTYVLGYAACAVQAGDRMYMKQTDCRELYRLLKREFGD